MGRRTALVTGGSRGIGAAIARRLANCGYALTIAARREQGLVRFASQLREETGVPVQAVVANLAEESKVREVAAAHASYFDRLDLLVLNAGVGSIANVSETPTKSYDLVLGVNLRSPFLLVRECLPQLRETARTDPARGAKIIGLGSISGVVGEPGIAAYGASKAAMISMCETVTAEESEHGVTASVISPGYVDTDLTEAVRGQVDQEDMLASEDVVELVLAISNLSAKAVVPNAVVTRAGRYIWRA